MSEANPYQWQDDFLEKCTTHFDCDDHDFLLVVTPGGGKTIAALKVARKLLRSGLVKRIVVVAPTRAVVGQWVESANSLGLDLDSNGELGRKRNYHGLVLTYNGVAANPIVYRAYCNVPTLVILDEVHHADMQESWGEALRQAFDAPHNYRLLLSGTPFRTTGRIPFIKYDLSEPGRFKAVADFSFSHGDAVEAGCCRQVFFPSIEVPHVEWARGDRKFAASLSDTSLKEEQERDRNSVVIDPSSPAVRLLLEQAHAKLLEIRRTNRKAAGLVLAKNIWHAQELAKLMEDIAGTKPLCVVSDDAEALDHLKRFKKSDDAWIVSVRMISEGADVPRFQVEAYLTSIDTPLFFRQAVGRITRQTPKASTEYAYMFILGREPLTTFAAELEAEQQSRDKSEPDEPGKSRDDSDLGDAAVLISCDAEVGATILTGGADAIPTEELSMGAFLSDRLDGNNPPELVALLLRDLKHRENGNEEPKRPREPKTDRMKRKGKLANSKAFRVGKMRGYADDEAAQKMHREWKERSASHHWQGEMDEPELDRKIEWLCQEEARFQAV